MLIHSTTLFDSLTLMEWFRVIFTMKKASTSALIISTFMFGKTQSDITSTDIANGISVDDQNDLNQNTTVYTISNPQIDPREKAWIKKWMSWRLAQCSGK
jgi:hypothetical protein